MKKSVEAYVLALETINRLTITYRVETFCTLVCNAWELLLKARLLEGATDTKVIYYKLKPGERPKSLSLRDCLIRVFPDDRDDMRRNIERVEELRDAAIHLFISDVPKDVLGLLQACVLNYHRCLNDWFAVTLSDRVPVGMMTIVFDVSPEQLDLASPIMRRKLGKDAADYLTGLSQELRTEHDEHGYSQAFSVLIKYELAIQKDPERAAVLAVSSEAGVPARKIGVARDPYTDWPWREKELLTELNARLAPAKITPHDVRSVVLAHRVRSRREWFFRSGLPSSPGQYSPAFADWFVKRCRQEPGFLAKSHASWRAAHAKAGPGSPVLAVPAYT